MATPFDYTGPGLERIGLQWTDCLDGKSPESAAAWIALNVRNYDGKLNLKKDAKPGVDHHAQGKALLAAYRASDDVRDGGRATRSKGTDGERQSATAVRIWLRDTHKELRTLKRTSTDAALRALPALGDVEDSDRLLEIATNVVSLLVNPEFAAAAAKIGIGGADAAEGKKRIDAWQTARSGAGVSRGAEKTSTKGNMGARLAFATWLTLWWGIAKVRCKDQPGVLKALGVEVKSLRGGSGGGTSGSGGGTSGSGGTGDGSAPK